MKVLCMAIAASSAASGLSVLIVAVSKEGPLASAAAIAWASTYTTLGLLPNFVWKARALFFHSLYVVYGMHVS